MARAYAVRRPVVNSYLVRERDRRRLRELGWVLLTVVPVGLCCVGYVWLHLEVLAAGYRIDSLERTLEKQVQVERRLGLELSRQMRPGSIERRSLEELEMQVPSPDQLVPLEGPP